MLIPGALGFPRMGWVGIATMRDDVGGTTQAWPEDRAIMAALAERGFEARHVPWTAPDEAWAGASMCVIRSVWDYTQRPAEFLAWTRRIERMVPTWNPPALVRWNAHKAYLFELEERGLPLPTTWRVPRGGALDLARPVREHGGLVVKPIVDVGALGALRVSSEAEVGAAQAHLARLVENGEALVQPFLHSILEEGELSLLFFGGAFSHAVRKRPKPGDYRVQAGWGGRAEPVEPPAEALALARRVLAAIPHETLHARVDLVRANDGRLALMELEAIEPHLFLAHAEGAAARYADAVLDRLRRGPAPLWRS